MKVTRKVIACPSNSKSPGQTHHVDISGERFSSDGLGTGVGCAEVPVGEATLNVAAGFYTGRRRMLERKTASVKVLVTGQESDTLVVAVSLSQRFAVQFWGVREITI